MKKILEYAGVEVTCQMFDEVIVDNKSQQDVIMTFKEEQSGTESWVLRPGERNDQKKDLPRGCYYVGIKPKDGEVATVCVVVSRV